MPKKDRCPNVLPYAAEAWERREGKKGASVMGSCGGYCNRSTRVLCTVPENGLAQKNRLEKNGRNYGYLEQQREEGIARFTPVKAGVWQGSGSLRTGCSKIVSTKIKFYQYNYLFFFISSRLFGGASITLRCIPLPQTHLHVYNTSTTTTWKI